MPARNPPTTGYGTNRISAAEPEPPDHQEHDPAQDRHDEGRGDDGQEDVGTLVVLQAGDACAMCARSAAFAAAAAATSPRTAAAASCTLPTTPREPDAPREERERQRRRSEVQADAVGQAGTSKPPKTRAANAIASTHSTAPMIRPAATEASHVVVRRCSTIGVSPSRQSSSTSNVRIVSVSRSASVVASHRCSAAASSGSSASSRSIDSRPMRRTTLGASATTSAVRGTLGVERDLADHDPGAERPEPEPRALGRDGLHAQAPGLEHVDVARRVVLVEQDRALGHRDALEVGGEARWQAVGAGGGGVLRLGLRQARGR